MQKKDRSRRIRRFTWLFLGIVRDFRREAKLAAKIGGQAARERMSDRHRRRAIEFRKTALEMGGVVIKLGQFFSARVDIMPDEYIEELARLQDTVPPVPFGEIKAAIERDFGRPLEDIFSQFNNEAHAAASLAQVHKAKLSTGEEVAVKVLRPGIEELVDIDLATFAYLMNGVHRFTKFGKRTDIPTVIDEFARTLGDELDFYREGYNAIRFREMFAGDPIIYIPKIYRDFSSDHVLTLELVEGIKISDYEELERQGIDRHQVADEVVQSYMKQVLDEGFFHADPHPGNLFVVPGPIITFVDFGMVGEITPEMKASLREAIIGIARRDAQAIVEGFSKLGFIRRGADVISIVRALNWLLDNYGAINARNITFENLENIEEDIRRIIHDQPITVPAQFAFLGRALSTLLGLATGLDPEFDFVGATRPYVEKMTRGGAEAILKLVTDELKTLGQIFLSMPRQLSDTLNKLQKGELSVRVDAAGVTRALNSGYRSRVQTARSISLAMILATVVALLYLNFSREAYFFMAAALVVIISLVRPSRR